MLLTFCYVWNVAFIPKFCYSHSVPLLITPSCYNRLYNCKVHTTFKFSLKQTLHVLINIKNSLENYFCNAPTSHIASVLRDTDKHDPERSGFGSRFEFSGSDLDLSFREKLDPDSVCMVWYQVYKGQGRWWTLALGDFWKFVTKIMNFRHTVSHLKFSLKFWNFTNISS